MLYLPMDRLSMPQADEAMEAVSDVSEYGYVRALDLQGRGASKAKQVKRKVPIIHLSIACSINSIQFNSINICLQGSLR
jgi:hypothetical protein